MLNACSWRSSFEIYFAPAGGEAAHVTSMPGLATLDRDAEDREKRVITALNE